MIQIVEHTAAESPCAIGAALAATGLPVRVCRAWAGERLPDTVDGMVALVVLDGPTGTLGLTAQLALLRAALEAEVPVLGLGTGARLLALAADGDTAKHALPDHSRTPHDETDVRVLRITPSAWGLRFHQVPHADGVYDRFATLVANRAEHTTTRAFFTRRAASWDERFTDDGPRYTAAAHRMELRPGQRVLDVGCGTGRVLPALRDQVGPAGVVAGVDLTPAMLTAAARQGRGGQGHLVLADACRLPLRAGAVDGVFSAGLLNHLPDPRRALCEWARITAPDGVLLLFHPSGHAERAARHGRPLAPDDPLTENNLLPALRATGWHPACYEDAPHHFLLRAVRRAD
ncbi:methyltransferase domain-containing protein [Streptomyces sp. LaPpAH-108]|uniref:methyltransferase domain-containing protein n=1 Tax=Streptomyces sp. LaPpAH-108 TaxID=1155714 RepID=UPI00037F2CC3|nr:class I SAM-dependent methyltransferase [Streptomyces sp. LaPpAH-108]